MKTPLHRVPSGGALIRSSASLQVVESIFTGTSLLEPTPERYAQFILLTQGLVVISKPVFEKNDLPAPPISSCPCSFRAAFSATIASPKFTQHESLQGFGSTDRQSKPRSRSTVSAHRLFSSSSVLPFVSFLSISSAANEAGSWRARTQRVSWLPRAIVLLDRCAFMRNQAGSEGGGFRLHAYANGPCPQCQLALNQDAIKRVSFLSHSNSC